MTHIPNPELFRSFILFHHQKTEVTRMPAFDANDSRRVIEDFPKGKRGLAKGLFNVAVGKLGAMKGQEERNGQIMSEGGNMKMFKYAERYGDSTATAVRIQNRLSYLEKAFPGIVRTLITNGTASLMHQVQAALDRKMNRG